jgi:SAM-dependent methyltransferase
MPFAQLQRFLRSSFNFPRRNTPSLPGLAYWEQRAQTYGCRAVLNLGHKEQDIEKVTRYQVDIIFPHLTGLLRGNERVTLDYGCGTGRFTPHLARATGGKVIGVDPTHTLLELAPAGAGIEYQLSDGRLIPLADTCVDLAWICLVLGGLRNAHLSETVRELNRVLRPDGLLFLVENTSPKQHCDHWEFRSVSEYQKLFAFAALDHLDDYDDLGERISIMAGRKA